MTMPIGQSHGTGLHRVQWDADGGIRLELLGSVRFPKGHQGLRHSHSFWEIVFIGEGRGTLEQGAGRIPVAEGDILLVPPGAFHRFDAAHAPLDQFYFGFSFDFAHPGPAASTIVRALARGPSSDIFRHELRECLDALRKQGREDSIRGRLLGLAGRVMRWVAPPAPGQAGRGRVGSPVLLAREFLQTDLKGRHDVQDLAHRFCLSPQYFGEIFKRETGVSVKEFQRECRLERAMALLREGALSITEVAAEVGLEDIAYFSRLFKRRYGIPPRQARSRLLAGTDVPA